MSPFDLDEARRGLEACLRTIREVKARFADSPAHALGYFPEGRCDHFPAALQPVETAAAFLGLDPGRVIHAREHRCSTPPRTYSGPYCVYLPSDSPVETAAAAAELTRQLAALGPTFNELVQALTGASAVWAADRLPADLGSWWEGLFHLAVHFPAAFLEARRGRWAAQTGRTGRRWPPAFLWEDHLRFSGSGPPLDDVVPGVIWVVLKCDVFTSTERAVESLCQRLTPAAPAPPVDFAALHGHFSKIGGRLRALPEGVASRPRLVKFASTFLSEPTRQWCDFSMRTEFGRLLLSRCHAEAEYLVHRGTPREEVALWAESGAGLPASVTDGAVMFTNTGPSEYPGLTVRVGCGASYLNPAPEARWVRFVLNTLNGHGLKVRWRHPLERPADLSLPLYGDAALPFDFATASARAIEHAGLLGVPPTPAPRATPKPEAPGMTPSERGRTPADQAGVSSSGRASIRTPEKPGANLVRPDGPQGGKWLWFNNNRFEIGSGITYALIDYMWARESAHFDDLMGNEGSVWENAQNGKNVTTAVTRANAKLPPNFPWRLAVNAVNRYVTKEAK